MFKKITLFSAVIALAACSSTPDMPAETDADSQNGSNQTMEGGLESSAISDREAMEANALAQATAREAALLRQLTIYFDYDSSQFNDDFIPVLDAHARYLRDNPGARIRMEGHSDERGSREYNIALGERRGEAVRRALLLRGAARAQLLVVSYGEERPAVLGASEASWAKNRRVVLVYQ